MSCLIFGYDRGQQATWQHVNSMASSKHSTDGEHYFIGTFWGGGILAAQVLFTSRPLSECKGVCWFSLSPEPLTAVTVTLGSFFVCPAQE